MSPWPLPGALNVSLGTAPGNTHVPSNAYCPSRIYTLSHGAGPGNTHAHIHTPGHGP